MKYGFIYETTNLINGKKYIGQHKRSNYDPADTDDSWYLGSGKYLVNAVAKYGAENFSRRILCECDSAEELNDKERYYIEYYDAVNSEDYYNLSIDAYPHSASGEEHWIHKRQGGHLSEEHREHLKESSKIRWSKEENRRDMSIKVSKTLIGNQRRLGTTQSQETRMKISEGNRGKEIPSHVKAINSELRTRDNAIKFTGTKWINNGVLEKRHKGELPDGWTYGRLSKNFNPGKSSEFSDRVQIKI